MLVTIIASISLVSGVSFGWYAATLLKQHKERSEQKTMLERTPTALIEQELEKRGTINKSPFR